jgi:hypothetical protein
LHVDSINQDPAASTSSGDLTPLQIIRTETVLSRLPIHNLAKKGNVEIKIIRKDDRGKVELVWEVSPNPKFGMPRALAYKLDTVVINRRIDEEGRPLPKVICLGSLREIADVLRLGADTNLVKNALRQNASTFITAKFMYKANDGTERRIEADFTRYGVVFTGEKLPDGRKADAVYIILNDPYREVLNNAPVRPLNYDYLRELKPAAQRFYEIISRVFFTTLKYDHGVAKLSYSDYCTYSAQVRSYNWNNVRPQMYEVHKPHLKSGYLASVRSEEATDGEGKPDWIFYYTPGPKARAEFDTFSNRRKPRLQGSLEAANIVDLPTVASESSLDTPTTAATLHDDTTSLLTELLKRGITDRQARKILSARQNPEELVDQLEYGDFVVAQNPRKFRNPPGFYISLINDNIIPPEHFETTRKRRLREERAQARQQWLFEEQRLRSEYDHEYCPQEKDRYIRENLSREDYEERLHKYERQYRQQWPNVTAETITQIAHGRIRGDIEPAVKLLSFQEWKEQRSARIA